MADRRETPVRQRYLYISALACASRTSRYLQNVPRVHVVLRGKMDSLERTLANIRSKAVELRDTFGDERQARAIEWAASLVERALQEQADERLTLAEASARSGYSPDHLARLIREGRLPNAGRPHAPRIRAGDLPRRSPRHNVVVTNGPRPYDPLADARAIGSRR